MDIPRVFQDLDKYLHPNKVLLIYGPRQAGKTTLLKNFLQTTSLKYRFDSGDNISIQHLLSSQDFGLIKEYAQNYQLIVIDEAQKIKGIGQALKIMVDQIPDIKIIATGSSSFELAGQVGEPLTGRKKTLTLYPIAYVELNMLYNRHELKEQLEKILIYGSYPEVITTSSVKKAELIMEMSQSYLLKDILEFDKVKNSKTLVDLLRLLAFQVGSEVSLSELAQQLGIDTKTVARYIDLLEKSFVIYNLRGFSRNLRKEITKKSKYYFYDNGMRNAIIANFNSLNLRDDVGKLWENFLIMERIKKQSYAGIYTNKYFWRTWDQKEIDFVEEYEGVLHGFEFKWGKTTAKAPKEWLSTYSNAKFTVINSENYLDFIL
ncbi:MAG: ATP-binding protein [Gammaproteobacteria bacterium]|jgi:predicted AAA+ superfamily ATPase